MKLLFDLAPLQTSTFGNTNHGGGKYAKTVLNKLIDSNPSCDLFFLYDSNKYIEENIIEECNKRGFVIEKFQSKYDIPGILKRHNINRFYSALASDYYDLDFGELQFYFTIHGPRPIELPFDDYELKYDLRLRSKFQYYYKKYLTERYKSKLKKRYILL